MTLRSPKPRRSFERTFIVVYVYAYLRGIHRRLMLSAVTLERCCTQALFLMSNNPRLVIGLRTHSCD